MLGKSSRKLSFDKETLRTLRDAQLGAVVGGQGVVIVRTHLPPPPPPSLTCMTLCGCPNTTEFTRICFKH